MPGASGERGSARGGQWVPVVELLGGFTFYQHVAVVESLEVSFDDVATRVVDPHALSVWVTIKESVSHGSENVGNLTAG